MARITGKNGQIKIGSTVVAMITDWSLDLKIPIADATAMGDTFQNKLALIREWSGQVKGIYGNASEQTLLLSSWVAATTAGGSTGGQVTLVLYPDAATAENWSGAVYIDMNISVDKAKTDEFAAKFTGTGTLTYTPNS